MPGNIKFFVFLEQEPITNATQKKLKRKKYQSLDHFMKDIDIMFNNAKSYNEDESQIHREAEYLQVNSVISCL